MLNAHVRDVSTRTMLPTVSMRSSTFRPLSISPSSYFATSPIHYLVVVFPHRNPVRLGIRFLDPLLKHKSLSPLSQHPRKLHLCSFIHSVVITPHHGPDHRCSTVLRQATHSPPYFHRFPCRHFPYIPEFRLSRTSRYYWEPNGYNFPMQLWGNWT
jgi:hypothetical protein